jgi:hypothetical protein
MKITTKNEELAIRELATATITMTTTIEDFWFA